MGKKSNRHIQVGKRISMKAMVWTKYGPPDVLQLREVEKPVPEEDEVLIRIHATTVTAGDCEMRRLKIPFLLRLPMRLYVGVGRPRRMTILGQELAGEIEGVGRKVRRFKEGDRVFAATGFGLGAYAEYICLPEDGVMTMMPADLTWEEAAAVPVAGLEALYFLRKGNIQKGEQILIIGAGGSIGTAAVQLARYYGAVVTGVDLGEKLEALRSIGADHVVDYTRKEDAGGGRTYDVIFDVPGKSPFTRSLRMLRPNGRYLLGNSGMLRKVRGAWVSGIGSRKVLFGTAEQKTEDLVFLKKLIEAGEWKPVIDRIYPLKEMVEAHRYVESGKKMGNVAISILHSDKIK